MRQPISGWMLFAIPVAAFGFAWLVLGIDLFSTESVKWKDEPPTGTGVDPAWRWVGRIAGFLYLGLVFAWWRQRSARRAYERRTPEIAEILRGIESAQDQETIDRLIAQADKVLRKLLSVDLESFNRDVAQQRHEARARAIASLVEQQEARLAREGASDSRH